MLDALLLMLATPADTALFDTTTGYRIAHYRAVVPAPPPGIPDVDDAGAVALHDGGTALFVDVTPASGGHRNAVTGVWRLAEPHDTIPGAHWFPEAGRGLADAVIDDWFARGIKRLAKGRRHTIVVFCLADCWMSWNASWKLRRLGYRDVRWYANGADGWRDIDRTFVPSVPER